MEDVSREMQDDELEIPQSRMPEPDFDDTDYRPSPGTAHTFATSLADHAAFKAAAREACLNFLAHGSEPRFVDEIRGIDQSVFHPVLPVGLSRFSSLLTLPLMNHIQLLHVSAWTRLDPIS